MTPDELGGVGQRESAKAALGNETLRRLDQRLLQIAVVVALSVERAAPMPHRLDSCCSCPSTLERAEVSRLGSPALQDEPRVRRWFTASGGRPA